MILPNARSQSSWLDVFAPLPETAKTMATGILTRNLSGNHVFVTERKWTYSPPRIKMELVYDELEPPVNPGNAGERYLLYSQEEVKTGGNLHGSKVQIIPLNSAEAKEAILKYADRKEFIGDINPSWQFCETDNDCVQSRNQCGSLIGINKNYQKNYSAFLKTRNFDCSKETSDQIGKTYVPKCRESFCMEPPIRVRTFFGFEF